MFQELSVLSELLRSALAQIILWNLLSKLAQNSADAERVSHQLSLNLLQSTLEPSAEPPYSQPFGLALPSGIAGILGIHDFAELPVRAE